MNSISYVKILGLSSHAHGRTKNISYHFSFSPNPNTLNDQDNQPTNLPFLRWWPPLPSPHLWITRIMALQVPIQMTKPPNPLFVASLTTPRCVAYNFCSCKNIEMVPSTITSMPTPLPMVALLNLWSIIMILLIVEEITSKEMYPVMHKLLKTLFFMMMSKWLFQQ